VACIISSRHDSVCRRKKVVVKKDKAEPQQQEDVAAANRVSNLQVHQCQKVRQILLANFGLHE
jgi:hypothetical protein